ncbi:hypothetical protein ACVDFE_07855 [Lentzea chajnantorensis]
MTTTVGHIKAIISADASPIKGTFRETKAASRDMKRDVEAQKPKLDADEKPFVAAIKRVEAAKGSFDAKIRKTVADLEANLVKAGDAEQTALGRIRVAQAALDAVRDKSPDKIERVAAAEERLAKAQRDLTAIQRDQSVMTDRLTEARGKLAAATESAKNAAADASDGHDKAGAAAGRHAASLLKLVGTLGVTNGAMLAGGVIAGAAVAALPVAAIAAAGVLLANNQAVADSYGDLADGVVRDARAMAQPLEDDLVRASDKLAASWYRMRPALHAVFADSEPAVRELTAGVTGFAENAVPGMATAVRRSEPVMVGWRRLLADTGTGFSEFFTNVSSDTESTGENIAAFGKAIRTVMSSSGTLLQQLSTNFAPYAADFADVFERVLHVVTEFSDGALPVLGTSLGVALDVLQAVLSVVEPIADEVGTLTGVLLSGAAAWKVYSAAIGLVSKVPVASALTNSVVAAGPLTGMLSKLGLGAGAAASGAGALTGALSPLGIGLAATALLMGTYAMQQKKLADDADDFVKGIAKGGDAAKSAMDKHVAATRSLDDLIKKRDEWNASDQARALGADDVIGGRMNDEIYALGQAVDTTRAAWDKYRDSVGPVERAQADLNFAIARYGKESPQATAAASGYRDEVAKQEAASRDAADAVKSHTDKLLEQQSIMLGSVSAGVNYRSALLGLEQAQKGLNDAVQRSGRDSLEARTAQNQYEQSLLNVVGAAAKLAEAEHAGADAATMSKAVTEAQTREILNLAAAAGTNAPPALQKMVAGLDGAALAAMGVTVKVDETGKAVFRMPDGKEIVITGQNADAMRKIEEVNAAELKAKTLYINTVMRAESRNAVAQDWLTGGLNGGGWVPGSGPDQDDRLVPLTSKEFVVNRRAAQKHGRLLEAINASEGGDVRMPESALASLPMPRTPTTLTATSSTTVSGGGQAPAGSSGRTVHIGSINLTEVKTMPSKQWLSDTLTDIVEGVMVDHE